MKIATPYEMNQIDKIAINEFLIPGIVLMENAALSVVDEIRKSIGSLIGKKSVILAGKGNNAGDAFAVARHLHNSGVSVKIYILSKKNEILADAKTNLDIVEKLGIYNLEILKLEYIKYLKNSLESCDFCVDGIFGTGLRGDIKDLAKEIIEITNNLSKFTVSIDIPSGVDGETGEILGTCIKAHKTVAFALPKLGEIIYPGCDYTGELIVRDIGIPTKIIEDLNIKRDIIDKYYVKDMLPKRRKNSNKGDYGKVFVITGSTGMTGAGYFTAVASLRVGAGLLYLGVPSSLTPIYDSLLPEAITIPLNDSGTGHIKKNSLENIKDRLKSVNVVALGPGLVENDDTTYIVSNIIKNSNIPLVLDAGALNCLQNNVNILKELKVEAVITPHPGEMARLLGITIKEVQENRIKVASELSKEMGVTVLLKGAKTIIASKDGSVYININGNSGMATAGTGDILTGIIAGLIAQGLEVKDSAILGAYIHGLSGDNIAKINGEHGLIAGDLLLEIPKVIKQI